MRAHLDGLWRSPDFLKLWTGQTVSMFGTFASWTALPFTAILVLHASPFQVAALTAADRIAGIAVGLFAGVWVDRLRRRPLMIAADLGRAALLLTIPLAYALDLLHIAQLFVVALCTGVLTLLFDVSYQSYLPTLVRREQLVEGNSKLAASVSAAEFGGFGLGGWLVQLLTAPFAILCDALSFVVSAACVLLIRTPEPPPAPVADRASMRTEIAEGLRAVFHDGVLRALAASAFSEAFARGVIGALVLLYLNQELGFGPGVLGVIFAVGGLTSLLGAMATGPVVRRLGVGPALIVGQLVAALGTLCLLAADDTSALAVVLLVANQCITDPSATLADITATSVRQSITPDRLLGRVNASIRFASLGMMLAGALIAGVLGELIGLRPALSLGVAVNFLPVLWLACSPVRTMRRMTIAPILDPVPAGDAVVIERSMLDALPASHVSRQNAPRVEID